MVDALRIVVLNGSLGYGYELASLDAGMAAAPHLIGCDSGSTDPGPYYLGSGRSLVKAVVPHEQLDDEVAKWCAEIMAMSSTTLAIAKRSFNADSENIRGISALGMQGLALYYETEESREGGNAFREKRKPEFRKLAK